MTIKDELYIEIDWLYKQLNGDEKNDTLVLDLIKCCECELEQLGKGDSK
jgi:hypothetical protein